MSAITKGWIYSGIGLVLAAGGVGAALYGAGQARVANELPLGHSQYQTYYAQASNVTFAGYGAAGIGAISLGVGASYLFGKQGFSRRGVGWSLCTVGSVAAVTGSWLLIDAVNLATKANEMNVDDYRYTGSYASAQSNYLAGAVALGAGAITAGLGLYLALTGSRASTASVAKPAVSVAVSPTLSSGRSGAAFTLRW